VQARLPGRAWLRSAVVGSLPVTAAPLPAPGPTRRAVLVAGLAAPLAACTGGSPEPVPSPSPAPVDPDVALRAAAVERERTLLAAYDDVLARGGARAAALRPLREEHASHLAALDPALAVPTPAPAPSAAPASTVARLRAAEREAAAAHAADAVPASRGLAALLASLAAAEAAHLVALA
jgi:hypothetical protein